MESFNIAKDIASLPLEAQKQVIDFIDYMKFRYSSVREDACEERSELSNEPFIGMWADREDMKDSTEWIRELRCREWGSTKIDSRTG